MKSDYIQHNMDTRMVNIEICETINNDWELIIDAEIKDKGGFQRHYNRTSNLPTYELAVKKGMAFHKKHLYDFGLGDGKITHIVKILEYDDKGD